MIIPVKCMTCGKVLANKWVKYQEKCAQLESGDKSANVDDNFELADNFSKNLKHKILNDLGIKRICCRRHMLSHVDLVDII